MQFFLSVSFRDDNDGAFNVGVESGLASSFVAVVETSYYNL